MIELCCPHKQTLPESVRKDAIDMRKCDADQIFLEIIPSSHLLLTWLKGNDTVTHLIATKVFAIHFHEIPF